MDSLARFLWFEAHGGEECPPDYIPAEADLVAWLGTDGPDPTNAAELLAAVLPTPEGAAWSWDAVAIGFENADPAPLRLMAARVAPEGLAFTPMERVHAAWLACEPRPRHPLAPVLEAWQERPKDVEPDAKDRAIAPGPLFAWANAHGRGPVILKHPRHDNELPFRPGLVEPDTPELPLPGMETPATQIVPAPAIVLADAAGFGGMVPGRGARLDKRLLTLALLSIPREERRPGGRYTLRIPLRRSDPKRPALIDDWLWPAPAETGTGMGKRSEWKPAKHGRRLLRAINAVSLAGVRLPKGGEWRPVVARYVPNMYDLDGEVIFEIALPDEADHGPMIDRRGLVAAGVVSDPAFDGCLALASLWDVTKARNGGIRIYATRPKALRDTQGRLTRADGTLILGHPRNPFTVKGKDGRNRLEWRSGDDPQRDWRTPAAVLAGEERHPQADKMPALDRNDRRRLFYGVASDAIDSGNRARLANKAEDRLADLETEGRVVIEREGSGWRILEPAPSRS